MKSCPTCQGSFPTNFAVCPQDGTQLVEAGTWAVGSVVRGKYRLVAKIGQGGMGTVYKALHLAFDEMRALKVMSPQLMTDDLFVKRFKHEAVITRKLQHPNAVRVDDIDEAEDGRPFIVMEFIEGRSLKDLIREQGPLPVPRVCAIIKQVASALDAAHRINMIHRDIKPENIVLVQGPEGEQAKVLDFGIAKMKEARKGARGSMTLTETGMVIGTPQYMSPEQAMGQRGDQLDGRSDLYSLGVVMYQMLTADLPFKAETTMEMILAHLQKPPAPISLAHPELGLPEPIIALTMRLLEKAREQRPPSAHALIEEVEAAEQAVAREPALPPTQRLSVSDMLRAAPPVQPAPVAPRGAPTIREAAAQAPLAPPVQPPSPVAAAPPQPAPVPVATAKSTNLGLWIGVAVLAIVLGGGGWYFLGRHATPGAGPSGGTDGTPTGQETTPERPTSTAPASGAGTSTPAGGQGSGPSQQPNPSAESGTAPVSEPVSRPKGPDRVVREAPRQAVDMRKIKGHITLGNYYLNQGEYEKAIEEYKAGQQLDPGNAELRQLVKKAERARDAERRLLQR